MKASVQTSVAKFLLLTITLLNFDLVQCDLVGQLVPDVQRSAIQSLPSPHTHDETNAEGGGIRINRHTVHDPNEVRINLNIGGPE